MVTYNDKILVPNATKDGLDIIHPETNTGNVYDFVNSKWLDGTLRDYSSVIDMLNERFKFGIGSPEGVVSAPQGSIYLRNDGDTSTTLYVKTNSTVNTGWVAK